MHIEHPEEVEKQFSTVRRYTLLTIIFAVIALVLTSFLTKHYMYFAIGGFMIGMLFQFNGSTAQVHSNIVRTRTYLNKQEIEKRLEELKNS